MLEVQKYLITPGNSFETLTAELGIKVKFDGHLAKLCYDQIDSPKMHPIVMECRGLVLNRDTYAIVGACFTRFFNYGEALDITGKFDWANFFATEKVDGSWISLFYDHTDSRWRVTTRGSFADMEMYPDGPCWDGLVFDMLAGREEELPKDCTYIFELCTMHNKVVRAYKEPKLFLLGIITGDGKDVCDNFLYGVASHMGFDRPRKFRFGSVDDIVSFLLMNSATDATFEGVVVRDGNGLRIKIKSTTYLALHHLKGEGKNMFMPKYILPFVLSGEGAELLAYFPEVQSAYDAVNIAVAEHYAALSTVWDECKGIEDQKAFAQAVVPRTKFASILFNMRKRGTDNVESEFRLASDLILKVLNY